MEENIETGGPAFPCHPEIIPHRDHDFAGMTLRQYAAIKLRVPNSGTDWLDEMIRESLRDEMAKVAMNALEFRGDNGGRDPSGVLGEYMTGSEETAVVAYWMADAMLKAREVPHA